MKAAQMVAKAGAYLFRATRLHCPVCGKTPLFPRAVSVRRFYDWFVPFDGCPRCGYAFEREPGYFFMAMWAVNCGCGSLLGMITYLILELHFEPPLWALAPTVAMPVLLFNFLFARHVKAYFIALDHLFDPHERDGSDDDGNLRLDFDPEPEPPSAWRPEPGQPCGEAPPVR